MRELPAERLAVERIVKGGAAGDGRGVRVERGESAGGSRCRIGVIREVGKVHGRGGAGDYRSEGGEGRVDGRRWFRLFEVFEEGEEFGVGHFIAGLGQGGVG